MTEHILITLKYASSCKLKRTLPDAFFRRQLERCTTRPDYMSATIILMQGAEASLCSE